MNLLNLLIQWFLSVEIAHVVNPSFIATFMNILTALATHFSYVMSSFLNLVSMSINTWSMISLQVASKMKGHLVSTIAIFLLISLELMGGAEGKPQPGPQPAPAPAPGPKPQPAPAPNFLPLELQRAYCSWPWWRFGRCGCWRHPKWRRCINIFGK